MFKKFSDKSLIEGIRLQDDKALKHIYSTYYQMVKNNVLRNSGDSSDVDEVMQESVIVLYSQITDDKLDLTSDLKGYFFGISRMVWNNLLRQKQKHSVIEIDVADEVSAIYEDNNKVLEKAIERAMAMMKPDCREVILLFSQGFDYSEIADRLKFKSEEYARRKKYLCKEALMELIKNDPEYCDHFDFR
ncbi:MAG: sigma-70 family RNA polymerase sigma factor [Bacteroidales bacterium]